MEIINGRKKGGRTAPDRGRNVFIGSVLMGAGAIWLLYNTNVIDAALFNAIFSWQMLLVVIGGYLLCLRNWMAGSIIAGFGVLFMSADIFNLNISFSKVVLPMLLIIAGAAMLLSRRK